MEGLALNSARFSDAVPIVRTFGSINVLPNVKGAGKAKAARLSVTVRACRCGAAQSLTRKNPIGAKCIPGAEQLASALVEGSESTADEAMRKHLETPIGRFTPLFRWSSRVRYVERAVGREKAPCEAWSRNLPQNDSCAAGFRISRR